MVFEKVAAGGIELAAICSTCWRKRVFRGLTRPVTQLGSTLNPRLSTLDSPISPPTPAAP